MNNNCWISSDLSHSVFHIFYIYIYILIFLSNFKYGTGKTNNSVARQSVEQGQGDLHQENIGIGNIEMKSTVPTIVFVNNSSLTTVQNETDYHVIPWPNKMNPTVTGFYVFAGLSAAIIFYFVFRALRLRRRRSKVRRYGILASREDVEMTPLGDEDEDEDSTVFDINEHSRS